MLRFWVCLQLAVVVVNCCNLLREPVESTCEYEVPLKLTSRPKGLVVQQENCSAEFIKTEWQEEPEVVMGSADQDKTYTVIAIDPDAPSHEKGEYYLHWLVSNVNGSDLRIGDLTKGTKITEYKGPGPVENTGLHRYMFLTFEQENSNQTLEAPAERRKFALVPWLSAQKEKLCGPVAGMQFRTQY